MGEEDDGNNHVNYCIDLHTNLPQLRKNWAKCNVSVQEVTLENTEYVSDLPHMKYLGSDLKKKKKISFDPLLPAVWTSLVCRNEGFGISKAKSKTENQSTFGLERPMEVIFSHAVLHASIILTKRPHIVLTPIWDPFHQDSGHTWRRGDCRGEGGGGLRFDRRAVREILTSFSVVVTTPDWEFTQWGRKMYF